MTNLKMESDELDKLIEARLSFDARMLDETLLKDSKSNRNTYVSLESLQDQTKAVMQPLGLTIKQTTATENDKDYLITTLRHKSGQYERSVAYLFKHQETRTTEDAKTCGALMTYVQRYQWRSILGLGRGAEDFEDRSDSKNGVKQAQTQSKSSAPVKTADTDVIITDVQASKLIDMLSIDSRLEAAFFKALNIEDYFDLNQKDWDVALETAERIAQFYKKAQ